MTKATPHSLTHRIRSSESGASMVEAAFVFPVFLSLLFGIIQFGLIILAQVTLGNAAAVAARAGALDLDGIIDSAAIATITSVARDAVQPMLIVSQINAVNVTTPTLATGQAVKVEIVYDLPLLLRFVVPGVTSNQIRLRAQATMR